MTGPLQLLSAEDNVAVALRRIAPGEALEVDGQRLVAAEAIPMAHKIAIRPIPSGAVVVKFGVPIGRATAGITAGALVHVHNVRSDYINNAHEHFED
jgi:predicted homoserine dehydrogenase-like protein